MKCIISLLVLLSLGTHLHTNAQATDEYNGGMKVSLNQEGSKYFRIISWAQLWGQYNGEERLDANGNEESQVDFSIRRARILMYAQLTKNFLILTHFGLNSQNANNLHPLGKSESSQLFFHDVWGQWSINEKHAVGGGLHYWNGISRLNNQSTLNMMTLDNNRQSWSTIGLSDQFARHLGVYFKGSFGKLQYRVSVNEALTNNLDDTNASQVAAAYNGRALLGGKKAGKTFSGYFDYNFLDQESNFLPYKVGTYLGKKRVFNLGAGFFLHPNGSTIQNSDGSLSGENVSLFAIDAFYEAPLGANGAALTAYATYQNNDYGQNYTLGQTYESGSMLYGHVGYLIPSSSKTLRIQPYLSYSHRTIDALDDTANRLGLGGNLYLSGHHSKISLEYNNSQYGPGDNAGLFTVQAMIFL